MMRAPERFAGGGRRPPADPDLLLGRYRLRRPIGDGATSTVWLAHDERLDRPVAVKILRPGLLADAGARRRLRDEARSVARLSHPNVVGVHDVAMGHGRAAIVLEHVPGRSLLDRLREGPMAPSEALRIATGIAAGLAAAHRLGILHRDVKPANVLLGDDGRARLADFGIATALGDAATADAGGIAGSLRYLAPERLRGMASSPAADVWSVGVVAFRMLTGRMPFAGSSARELHDAAMAGPPTLHEPAVPADAAGAIARALDPDPARRPSAGDLAAALAAAASSTLAAAAVSGASDLNGSGPGRVDAGAAAGAGAGLVASATARAPAGTEAGAAGPDDSPTLPAGAAGPVLARTGPIVRSRRAVGALVAAVAAALLAAAAIAALLGGPRQAVPGEAGALPSPSTSAATSIPRPSAAASPTARPTVTAAPRAVAPARHAQGHGHGHGGDGQQGDAQGG